MKNLKNLADLVQNREGVVKVRLGNRLLGGSRRLTKVLDADVPTYKKAKSDFEFMYFTQLLYKCHGNASLAARLAEVNRPKIYDLLKISGLTLKDFK